MSPAETDSVHSVRGIPPSEILTPFPSIRSLLNSQVRRYGDRTFLIAYLPGSIRQELTYEDFSRKVFRGGNYLRDRKVDFGDRFEITSPGGLPALVEMFSTWTLGGAAVLKNDAGVKKAGNMEFLEAIDGFSDKFELGKKSRVDDDVVLVHARTAEGTTRRIRLSHYNLLVEAMAVAERQELSEESVVMCGIEVTDILGIAGCVMPALYAGGTVVLPSSFAAGSLSDLIEEEAPSSALVDRAFLSHFLENPVAAGKSLSPLCFLTADVQEITLDMLIEFEKRQRRQVLTGLSVAEAGSIATLSPLFRGDEPRQAWFEGHDGIPAGKALRISEMSILDEEGNELGENERGEIVLRGHSVMKGYLDDDPATAKAFRFGWLHTGATGYIRMAEDGDKYLFVTS